MDAYLRVTKSSDWPAAYGGVDGLIATIAQSLSEVMAAEIPEPGDIWDKDGWRTVFVSDTNARPEQDFRLLGWDAAWLDRSGGVYSLIVHYLLNNRPAGRQNFELNQHLLLTSQHDAHRLIEDWANWRPDKPGSKETFESDDQIRTLAVYDLRESEP
jgi:hypothetical protein